MDLLIVMQDWDFPHFTSTVDVNLPGFSTHTLHWRWAKLSFTGKWFNYGIIFMVMIFDLNMWKNQLFYIPEDYGQYIDPVSHKVYIVEDDAVLATGNRSLWSWEYRSLVHPETGKMLRENDPFMYSRWMGYSTVEKCTAFIPNLLGMTMFFTLITLYGRFPPNQDGTYGGRLKKRPRSSWRRERRSVCERYCTVDHECPQSMLADSLYRGSKCPNCVYLGTKCMSRCSSSQPDFKDTHYSDPALERTFPTMTDSKLTEMEGEYESHRQYTITQHSDPGVLEGRSAKDMQFCQSFEYRDMRMLENDMKSKNNESNEECGTPKREITTEDCVVLKGQVDLDLANDFSVNGKKRTLCSRNKNLLQNYLSQKCAGILKARKNKREDIEKDIASPKKPRTRILSKGEESLEPVHEHSEVDLSSNFVVDEQSAASSIKTRNSQKRNIKLPSVRFFDRRKKNDSCAESSPPQTRKLDETIPASCESSTLESHGRVFFSCQATTDGSGKIDSTDVEGVLFIKSKCETPDVVAYVRDDTGCDDSEHSSSSENLNRINFGSNPSVNL
ncbi:TMEM117 protein [Trinorchestia longiramus]|nr:TMEM117 protein [Trinorchestia longiramus]